MSKHDIIPLALTRRQAGALMLFIGEKLQKVRSGIWNTEDTIPFLEVAMYLEAHNIVWTDEGSDVYWWSITDNVDDFYNGELADPSASPMFLTEELAIEWVEAIEPNCRMYLWGHFGRGHMGPAKVWTGLGGGHDIEEYVKEDE